MFFTSLIVILVFSLAASCNMCGFSFSNNTDSQQEEEGPAGEEYSSQPANTASGESSDQQAGGQETSPQAEEDGDDDGEPVEEPEDGEPEDDSDDEDGVADIIPEEEDPGVYSESLRSIGALASLSGQIAEDRTVFIAADSPGTPSIFVGDTATAMLIKGYLSFDITEIDGDNVLGAWLNLSGSRVGNPPSLMGIFSVNYTNYGNSLEGTDWGGSSSAIFSSALSNIDFSFTNDELKDAVQDAIDSGRQYFQVKLSTQNANGNGAADGFTFMMSDISLEVGYN